MECNLGYNLDLTFEIILLIMKRSWIFLAFLIVISCSKPEETRELASAKELGESIAETAQRILMKNVAESMAKGGAEYAVEFCNEKAMVLTDSLSQNFEVEISRISDRNRNPKNALSETELELFKEFSENKSVIDTLISTDDQLTYYKRIELTMPTCLKCHGNPETDISSNTLKIIQEKYPYDKAKAYAIGDFRGLWKISFSD